MTNREEKIMKKLFSLVLIALLACGCLVACGEKKITSNDYVALYSSDLSNMDYVLTS